MGIVHANIVGIHFESCRRIVRLPRRISVPGARLSTGRQGARGRSAAHLKYNVQEMDHKIYRGEFKRMTVRRQETARQRQIQTFSR